MDFSQQDIDDNGFDDEEERRLFYVGLTRARDMAYLTYAIRRRRWGGSSDGVVSRFIRELPEKLIEWPEERADLDVEMSQDGISATVVQRRRSLGRRAQTFNGITDTPVLDDFVVGAWVEHKLFGKGRITARDGVGDNLKLTVEFTGGKSKKLVVRYANLTRL